MSLLTSEIFGAKVWFGFLYELGERIEYGRTRLTGRAVEWIPFQLDLFATPQIPELADEDDFWNRYRL